MDVHPHHVPETVGHEHSMGSGGNGIVGIALHETDLLEMVGEDATSSEVHVKPLRAGLGVLENPVMGGYDGIVDVELTGCEGATDRCGARIVGAVVVAGLGTGIAEHESPCLQLTVAGIAVLYLSVHGKDSLEGVAVAVGMGDALDESGDVFLSDSGTALTHGGSVHEIAYLRRLTEAFYLLRPLDSPHIDDGLDKGERCSLASLQGMEAEDVGELYHKVVTVLRQKVYGLSGLLRTAEAVCECAHRLRVGYADFCCEVTDGWYEAIPDDIVDVDVVAEERFGIVVNIDDTDECLPCLTEVVEEGGVLTEAVCVCRIVAGAVVVAEEDDESAADFCLEFVAARDVNFLAENHFLVFSRIVTKLTLILILLLGHIDFAALVVFEAVFEEGKFLGCHDADAEAVLHLPVALE